MRDLKNLILKQINLDDEIQTIKMAKKGNIIPTNVQNKEQGLGTICNSHF